MRIWGALAAGLSLLLLPAAGDGTGLSDQTDQTDRAVPGRRANDIIARVVGQRMSELARQPVIIENRSGQAGVLGTDAVAKAAPDGYTIAITSASSLVINPSLEKMPYDVRKDLAPVTLL